MEGTKEKSGFCVISIRLHLSRLFLSLRLQAPSILPRIRMVAFPLYISIHTAGPRLRFLIPITRNHAPSFIYLLTIFQLWFSICISRYLAWYIWTPQLVLDCRTRQTYPITSQETSRPPPIPTFFSSRWNKQTLKLPFFDFLEFHFSISTLHLYFFLE